ncbi:xanthine dehydrogenase family protein molybdopterin-binding subunit [Candidatus Poribacteria bacterium]|nr:xanthine dehydrogenase family protein molybdopterin-binding subunit [Candidatus Poribacteria bacterium]MBT5536232.1 xanthine dehydrogenase family protein molybdopterin-binding subunit [Candidatus Poribacteria bacterium]MBT5712852.1 xanthine dehydrogenase family protein molybdopterin-binding subunit [Candidatus Poribacteria bacterium]MBT7101024.1 xanthine dehydrogenase family protein molybdopterin-binding subunit [Candidatus Poribacteria bacterium]MBT7806744.1 xanthine dehydrogenase family pr
MGLGAGMTRRSFLQLLGAGLLVTTYSAVASGAADPGAAPEGSVAARLHVGEDGVITVMTGKVDVGQGARKQFTMAAAEELRAPMDSIRLILGDTGLTPDDGGTFGSRTTPSNIPDVRRACAAARELLTQGAARRWNVTAGEVTLSDGYAAHAATGERASYAELAADKDIAASFRAGQDDGVAVTSVDEWEVLGGLAPRPAIRDLVTGAHKFPSDVSRPGMLYGSVLRAPRYLSDLVGVDTASAEGMEGVQVVVDGDFVACVAPTSHAARKAVAQVAAGATWTHEPHTNSGDLFAHLKQTSRASDGRRSRGTSAGSTDAAFADAARVVEATYEVAYIQHVPMEPRAAVAEWADGRVTVWTGSQVPTRVHGQVAEAFGLPADSVRVIVPDTGGGFGGKHSGETAIEAARMAKAVGVPVSLRWTREEEFTWAYFRPSAVIEGRGGLDENGSLAAWEFETTNAGGSALDTPYDVPNVVTRSLDADGPLRQGSYRALGSTANVFARESLMDELAHAAGQDPLAFRLARLSHERLRAVLEDVAERADWAGRSRTPGVGMGLACGTEKGSYVAACAEVVVDEERRGIDLRHIWQTFECGAIQDPVNLDAQVRGCIIMGLGGALTEAMAFEDGRILNASLHQYRVPRFTDVPPMSIHLLNRPDLPSVGAGETPIVAVAPAIANAIFDAAGVRSRSMPLSLA